MWLSIKRCPEKYVKPGLVAAEQAMHIFLHPVSQRWLEISDDTVWGLASGAKGLNPYMGSSRET